MELRRNGRNAGACSPPPSVHGRPRESAAPRRTAWSGALITAVVCAALAAGCTDEVVCPIPTQPDALPFFSARVVEAATVRGDTTWVEVFATADPLPDYVVASINTRQIDQLGTAQSPGLLVTLRQSAIVWVPGTGCSLKVTTNYGFATSGETVPTGSQVSAPESVTVGEPLVLTWLPSDDADYYAISATLEEGLRDAVEISAVVEDTSVTIDADAIPFPGTVRGFVEAVAGPFPAVGADGNVGGVGWGFFSIAYRDPGSVFEVTVADTGGN